MKSAILLFLDHPLPLIAGLGPDDAPDPLALALVRDTLRGLADLDADVFAFTEAETDKDNARRVLGDAAKGLKITSPHGSSRQKRQRNAFRLAFARGYERVLLLPNAAPDLPVHVVQGALDWLNWKCCSLGPVPAVPGSEDMDGVYALGFDFEGYTTDVLDLIDQDRPKTCERMQNLLVFYERKLKMLPPYSPVTSLDEAAALAERCRDTRFARLPSVRLAAERAGL